MATYGVISSADFSPKLRADLVFRRGEDLNVVVVQVEATGQQHELDTLEFQVVRYMNGARSLDTVHQLARKHAPTLSRDAVVSLTAKLDGLGLISNSPAAAAPAPAPNGTGTSHEPMDVYEALEDDDFDEATIVDPQMITPLAQGTVKQTQLPPRTPAAVKFSSASSGVSLPPGATPVGSHTTPLPPGATPLPPGATPLPPGATPLPPGATPLPPGATPLPSGALPRPPESLPTSTDAIRQLPPQNAPAPGREPAPAPEPAAQRDAAADWEVEAVPWHKRKAIRRLLYLGVFAVVIAALAIIQYPLYVTESAVVKPESHVVIRAPVEGIVDEVMVSEGDAVEAGQPIARLDGRKLSYELQRAEAEYQQLAANLDKMKTGSRPEEIRRAQALVSEKAQDARFARKELTRANRLYKSGDISQSKRDEARRGYRVKSAALSQASAELRLVKAGFRDEEVKIAEANLSKAKADVEFFKKQLEMLLIKSPIDGTVLTPRFEERLHEKLNPGDPVVEIGDARRVRVEISVPERDADVIAVGQPIKLKVHSYPLRPFEGEITFIAPAVEERDGHRYIRVDAVIANPDAILQPRMTGYAEINTGERSLLNRISRRAVRWIRVRFLI